MPGTLLSLFLARKILSHVVSPKDALAENRAFPGRRNKTDEIPRESKKGERERERERESPEKGTVRSPGDLL